MSNLRISQLKSEVFEIGHGSATLLSQRGRIIEELLSYRNLWKDDMEMAFTGTTFGETIAAARKSRMLSQNQLVALLPELMRFLDARRLNDLEQDRTDPRRHPHADQLFKALAQALEVEEERLRELADDYERAAEMQRTFQRAIEFEAVAFRARTERG